MTNVAIVLSTKDRVELTTKTIAPLLDGARHQYFDLFVCDGSSEANESLTLDLAYPTASFHRNVRGGADAAIVYALTMLLNHPANYEYVGLVENDVLLDPDWFEPTFALFDKGQKDGLAPGAVSGRCYADRILVQQDGYALMHNLGAGMVLYHRAAAWLILDHFRTGWTTHNRAVFSYLSGIDIGRYWAFKGGEHWLCADWGFDRVLASHGYASLALTPSKCQMIGQNPPLADQGLILVDAPIAEFDNDTAFDRFVRMTTALQKGDRQLPPDIRHLDAQGELTFAHQLPGLGGNVWLGPNPESWTTKWAQGFGPFAWQSVEAGAYANFPLFGPAHILLNGGDHGASFKIVDEYSGFETTPTLQAGILGAVHVPAGFTYSNIKVIAVTPGGLLMGVQTTHRQPINTFYFDHSALPGLATGNKI